MMDCPDDFHEDNRSFSALKTGYGPTNRPNNQRINQLTVSDSPSMCVRVRACVCVRCFVNFFSFLNIVLASAPRVDYYYYFLSSIIIKRAQVVTRIFCHFLREKEEHSISLIDRKVTWDHQK